MMPSKLLRNKSVGSTPAFLETGSLVVKCLSQTLWSQHLLLSLSNSSSMKASVNHLEMSSPGMSALLELKNSHPSLVAQELPQRVSSPYTRKLLSQRRRKNNSQLQRKRSQPKKLHQRKKSTLSMPFHLPHGTSLTSRL